MASLDGGAACAFLQPHHFNPTIGVCPSGLPKLQLTIGGRLGQYKYFDMDKSIQAALEVAI